MSSPDDIRTLEGRLLLEAIYARSGYDFRGYSEASILRRLELIRQKTGDESFSQLQHRVLHNQGFLSKMIADLTVTTSEMFRDPEFFRNLRELVCPVLLTFPTINVWHAGCSTGEEVYSLAILLHEEGLLQRSRIYATDINTRALSTAREGIYSLPAMRTFTVNYQKAGGKRAFSDYYHAAYGAAHLSKELQANILFSEHNLASDEVFVETNLILCRNVLIYFQRKLQERALRLFSESLRRGGFLCLGTKEGLNHSRAIEEFERVDDRTKIFRKAYSVPSRARSAP